MNGFHFDLCYSRMVFYDTSSKERDSDPSNFMYNFFKTQASSILPSFAGPSGIPLPLIVFRIVLTANKYSTSSFDHDTLAAQLSNC
mmetsp:Transcript_17318/g.20022  ORF Transcript_17318/g.20022 Transcript_17318/m.20022 type:complete len:86 (+) Transcript_17318:186-443(+)